MLKKNPVLEAIVASGQVVLPSGDCLAVSSQINPACGAMLQKVILEVSPKVAVEVGLAYGVSTLYILDALREVGGQKLIGIDPSQNGQWKGGGLHNLELAGYRGMYEFHENTSQLVLPGLVGRGERVGFGFIDGWHTFDHMLVDFFYIDQMLDIGGVVVFDDVGYPALRRLSEFVLANRSYEIYGTVKHGGSPSMRQWAKRKLSDLLLPLYRTDQTPTPQIRQRLSVLDGVYFLALQKKAEDSRRWDHFVNF